MEGCKCIYSPYFKNKGHNGKMLNKFSILTYSLYRGCRERPVHGFQDWALGQIKAALPFDSAIWLTGTAQHGQYAVHTTHFHEISPQVLVDWARCKNRTVFTERVFRSPGTTFKCVAAEEFDPELLEHSRSYNIEHLLATTSIDPTSTLNELISLYRAAPNQPFSEEERLFQQNLVPHLAETWRINRMTHLNQLSQPICAINARSAATDVKGILHLIEPGFTQLLLDEWPDWRGPRLPDELVAQIENQGSRFVGKTLIVHLSSLSDLLLLRGRKKLPVDALSQREREVAGHFSAGRTYKEIAQSLALSPATVRNYLSTVYLKLGIGNKAELVNIMKKYD